MKSGQGFSWTVAARVGVRILSRRNVRLGGPAKQSEPVATEILMKGYNPVEGVQL